MSIQGLALLSITAVLVAIGLLIAWVASRRLDADRAKTYVRVGNIVAVIGFLLPGPLHTAGWIPIDTVSGGDGVAFSAAIMVFLGGIYVALQVLATSYVQYRKNREDGARAQAFIKHAVSNLTCMAVMFFLAILITLYAVLLAA